MLKHICLYKLIDFKLCTIREGFSLVIPLLVAMCVLTNLQAQEMPGQMVEIAATIIEYRHNNEEQFGIFYEYDPNPDNTDFGESNLFLHGTENVQDSPISALDITGNFAKFKYGTINFNLKTAIQKGWATVISNPTILVSDGQSASLASGEEFPTTKLTLSGNQTKLELQLRKTGIKLNVTPLILEGENILMNLEIESSEISRLDVFDRGDGLRYELPVVTTRNIKSVVIVPSERQLYIGGLYTDNTGDLTRKVPIAGDLPIIGYFLRGFNKTNRRTETIFQIVPSIKGPGLGLEDDHSIFSDLLKDEVIQQQRMLDQIPSGQMSSGTIEEVTGQPVILPDAVQAASSTISPASGEFPMQNPTPQTPTPTPTKKYWKALRLN
ncbi:MAG: hypothetical protein C4527_04910 [Candidatus Omnitrophota bacterium]|nr:MAG: hypothetical protein C4527_04910 [Candidatus Omnitrophota bacterium]